MGSVVLVDTFGFLFRIYHAMPALKDDAGMPTGLLLGFANLINTFYERGRTGSMVFALESEGVSHRKLEYQHYKANRESVPEELVSQIKVVVSWISKMGFKSVSVDGYEADDCIATLVRIAGKYGIDVEILSQDKDLYQLLREGVVLIDHASRKIVKEGDCKLRFGVYPASFTNYQSIVGDSSDNIPGIKGVGHKGAIKLLERFGNLDGIYESSQSELEALVGKRTARLVLESKDNAFLSLKLATLKDDLFDEFDFPIGASPNNPLMCIYDELESYGLKSVTRKLVNPDTNVAEQYRTPEQKGNQSQQGNGSKQSKSKSGYELEGIYHVVLDCDYPLQLNFGAKAASVVSKKKFRFNHKLILDERVLFHVLNSIPVSEPIAFDCETDGLDVKSSKMVGFSFCFNGTDGYYVPFLHSYLGAPRQIGLKHIKSALDLIFDHEVIGHNLKFDLAIVKNNFGILPKRGIKDSMILAWLYRPGEHVGLDKQMKKIFLYEMIPYETVVGRESTFSEVNLEIASEYACEDAVATFRLCYFLESILDKEILELAFSLEFPFVMTLIHMESNGIKVDVDYFKGLHSKLQGEMKALQEEIFKQIGMRFNINSTKQLSQILFENLELKSKRRTKSGFSTDETTLLSLKDEHPVIENIINYREVFKLATAYVAPILSARDSNSRVYTSFLQTGTATGRLSSKSPNLQSIPVRSSLGKEVRAGFIARDGYKLLSLDYSQIELRLLAHFSMDEDLIKSFYSGSDIHLETSKRIFGDEEAISHRSIAKSINFGLLYGMGPNKLSRTIGVSVSKAKEYISSYFDKFPTVKLFLKSAQEDILSRGYASTLLGRRRYFDFSAATDFVRSNYLREGVNTIFQGSAADLIKLSMNKILSLYPDILLLLQVHDELIFEVQEDAVSELAGKLKEVMNSIYELRVPLECGVSIGNNWAELK